jgi:hypothetical protein
MFFSCNNSPATDNAKAPLFAGDRVLVYPRITRTGAVGGAVFAIGTCIRAEGKGGGIRVRFDTAPKAKWWRNEYNKARNEGREFSELVPHCCLIKVVA